MTAIASKKLRDSANGESCTLNIAGICSYNNETTCLAHFPDESHGTSKKSDDISAGYACSSCHDVVDGRVKCPVVIGHCDCRICEYKRHKNFYMRRSQTRTLRKMIENGFVVVK